MSRMLLVHCLVFTSPVLAKTPGLELPSILVQGARPEAAVAEKRSGNLESELSRLSQRFDGAGEALRLAENSAAKPLPDADDLRRRIGQFAPVEISADISRLPENERRALGKMVQAAQVMDSIYLRQVWNGNEAMKAGLARDRSPLGLLRNEYFLRNKAPWDSLADDQVFIPGAPDHKPQGANFYPEDASKAEVEAWIKGLPSGEREQAEGFYTVVRRGPDGGLKLVPYSVEYGKDLKKAAALLKSAARLTSDPTLKEFLSSRAEAFSSDDYYASEIAWMKLDSAIEPTIGPYEVYQDNWFNYKAAFEAYIAVRDDAETAKLQEFSSRLQELEDALPIPREMKNPKLGGMAPIRVVDVVYNGGDAAHGVQAAAFNLPNDDRVIAQMGSKRVMLKNVQEAKFEKVLLPISRAALCEKDQPRVAFEAFFTHILMHEIMHGLGPHEIVVNGEKTTVRRQLQESFSAIEEAKADVSALWALQRLIDEGVLPKSMEEQMYATFLASSFRTLRFGIGEAHGKGQALQLNTFLDKGAVAVEPDGAFRVDPDKIKAAVTDLTRELMVIEGKGDAAAARAILAERGVLRPCAQAVLDKIKDVPVDIAPRFTSAKGLLKN
jgi:hypothetical protein